MLCGAGRGGERGEGDEEERASGGWRRLTGEDRGRGQSLTSR